MLPVLPLLVCAHLWRCTWASAVCHSLLLCYPASLLWWVVAAQVVYDHGPVEGFVWDDFSTCRERLASEWAALPPIADNISPSLKRKIFRQLEMRGKKLMW